MTIRSMFRAILLATLSPLFEKNVLKTIALDIPVCFSMSRLIVLAFAVATLRTVWRGGVGGWPEATLAITIVLALPLLGALERVDPIAVIDLVRSLIARVGMGDVRRVAPALATEPSKYDDHRMDG
jgi:hypothetical protein